jgi:lipid A ethanolaminephosphotransferase
LENTCQIFALGPNKLSSNILTGTASIIVIVAVLLAIFQDYASIMRNHTQLRYLVNPLNSFYAIGMVAAKPFQRNNQILLPHGA